ncbi:hypothetical protein HYPSUDRAFT_197681 [Hypholoma sublateritium FD-334 SS-4]|uniref:Hydrophobin n=1 Tax=Hypholoma sublateritium (strain FD-334 SS-4) TaxID=945553 RepID=A0A0D2PBB4_HYPSF|nr:hypothetical protein HYPSUDRAFT_197681 [Hypholoma sublateritium FD-334 SS-4]
MQFATLSTLTTLALAAFAVAVPTGSDPSNQCNTGAMQCCTSMATASQPAMSTLLGLVGAVVQDVTTQIGLVCSPITVVGVAGNSCSSQTVCCENNSFNGVVAIGCTPINVNL